MRTLLSALFCVVVVTAADLPRPMQRFLLPDAQAHDFDSNLFRGKAIILEFMSTKCEHCAKFAGVLRAAEQHYGKRLQVVGLVNPPDLPKDVSAFQIMYGVDYPILLDQGRVAYAYIRRQAFDIPYIFLIDPSGQIREEFEFNATSANLFQLPEVLFSHIDKLFSSSAAPAKK
jgi:thiol-disulfide isomerase/thioredoxin